MKKKAKAKEGRKMKLGKRNPREKLRKLKKRLKRMKKRFKKTKRRQEEQQSQEVPTGENRKPQLQMIMKLLVQHAMEGIIRVMQERYQA